MFAGDSYWYPNLTSLFYIIRVAPSSHMNPHIMVNSDFAATPFHFGQLASGLMSGSTFWRHAGEVLSTDSVSFQDSSCLLAFSFS